MVALCAFLCHVKGCKTVRYENGFLSTEVSGGLVPHLRDLLSLEEAPFKTSGFNPGDFFSEPPESEAINRLSPVTVSVIQSEQYLSEALKPYSSPSSRYRAHDPTFCGDEGIIPAHHDLAFRLSFIFFGRRFSLTSPTKVPRLHAEAERRRRRRRLLVVTGDFPLKISRLGNPSCSPTAQGMVSWIRHKDIHILSTGNYRYTTDERFASLHHPNSEDWTLRILRTTLNDSGLYECQLSTQPIKSVFLNLSVIEIPALAPIHRIPRSLPPASSRDNATRLDSDDVSWRSWPFGVRNSVAFIQRDELTATHRQMRSTTTTRTGLPSNADAAYDSSNISDGFIFRRVRKHAFSRIDCCPTLPSCKSREKNTNPIQFPELFTELLLEKEGLVSEAEEATRDRQDGLEPENSGFPQKCNFAWIALGPNILTLVLVGYIEAISVRPALEHQPRPRI
ncbi:unnamed protein product [Notodromas monacha]|uniref:Immunoglobulin V-set domain-containing protein n=1 Tax=Notodromas monacha TaxID=399045 RepID=A0A7R9GBM8_9CRUS|nr:unnamed protein product [Notodromas monacha]CAG0915218.1 unnamed protein product [Notodromas monacha]